jgi:hypothetical protein
VNSVSALTLKSSGFKHMRPEQLISLKPQDVVIALKLVAIKDASWSQSNLAKSVNMSTGFINQALQRLEQCNLYRSKRKIVLVDALKDFLVYGIRYVFPAQKGPTVRGVPTSIAAPPMSSHMAVSGLNWPPVWRDIRGEHQGYEIVPLCPAIALVIQDERFYELLALVDVFREGRTREKKIAAEELEARFNEYKLALK